MSGSLNLKPRKDIEDRYKWDLSSLCDNDENFYEGLKIVPKYIEKIKKFEGKLKDKEIILDFLKLDKELTERLEPLCQYAFLKHDEDLSEEKYNEMNEKLSSVITTLSVETSFASSELLELSDEMIDNIISDKRFSEYDRMFENIKKEKKHKLSKEEEKLLSGMDFLGGFSDVMRNISDLDTKFGEIEDSKGKKYPLTQSNYAKYLRSGDRTLRKNAFIKLNGSFGNMINTLSTNYISEIKANCYFAKVRNFDSALSRALDGEEVTEKVYNTLIKMVEKNLPLLFEYFNIKQRELGLKDMYIYDAMASTQKGDDEVYTYDEAIEIIKKATSVLGREYTELLERAKNERWIDVFPNDGKRSGAYESGIYGFHPYVLTNFEGDLDSVFTLAHELGHAMHSYFSDKNEPREKAGYTIFLAEIASTTNEILLIKYLLKDADSDRKKVLFNKLFDEVKSTIFRQTMFAQFEEEMHALHEKGEGLTRDKLCNSYFELNKKYFGEVKLVEETKYEWARIPHFFTAFYVYKYATGMITAISFANRMLSGEEGAVEDYFKFLSAGSNDDPISILKKSGCNLEDEKTFTSCFDYLKNILDEWKKLL